MIERNKQDDILRVSMPDFLYFIDIFGYIMKSYIKNSIYMEKATDKVYFSCGRS